jgi:hypothetical protein
MTNQTIKPFPNCPALDGYHCQTNSLKKIFHFHGHPLSEDLLLGLGAGMGFMYWRMKGNPDAGIADFVFISGRGNTKNFFTDIGERTGVKIDVHATASAKKGEESLFEKLRKEEPVMVYGDMGFLPWFNFPVEYHFGGHTFVICGFDGKDTLLASDMDPAAAGLKKGFFSPISLEQLRKARSSPYKPFPPKNTWLDFDFSRFHNPGKKEIHDAIKQMTETQLNPPIKNFGVKGIRHTAKEILAWPKVFSEYNLRMNLFQIYIFIEIGGTGGGCFRYMYARFLKEAAGITDNRKLASSADKITASGKLFTEIGQMFKDAQTAPDVNERIEIAGGVFGQIADIEEAAFHQLVSAIE